MARNLTRKGFASRFHTIARTIDNLQNRKHRFAASYLRRFCPIKVGQVIRIPRKGYFFVKSVRAEYDSDLHQMQWVAQGIQCRKDGFVNIHRAPWRSLREGEHFPAP